MWLVYFLHMYEYGTLKQVEVILRRGREIEVRIMKRMKRTEVTVHLYGNATCTTIVY
jgi:hypothetical protein